jgi:actin-binding LIM protein
MTVKIIVVTCSVERRRRWSDTYRGVPDSDEEDEVDGKEKKDDLEKIEDKKLKVMQFYV